MSTESMNFAANFSDALQDTPAQVKPDLSGKYINEYSKHLQGMTTNLAKCYEFGSLGQSKDANHGRVQELRARVAHCAALYVGCHLQVTTAFITQVSASMSFFVDLPLEQFKASIAVIVEDSRDMCTAGKFVADLHEGLRIDGLKLKQDAKTTGDVIEKDIKFKTDQAQRQTNKAQAHQDKAIAADAFILPSFAVGFALAPFSLGISVAAAAVVAGVAASYKGHHQKKEDKTNARLAITEKEKELAQEAAAQLAGPVTACIDSLCETMKVMTKIFNRLHVQLQQHKDKADKAATNPMEFGLYYSLMRALAQRIVKNCEAFQSIQPHIEEELWRLAAIDNNRSHTPYIIQAWLNAREEKLQLNSGWETFIKAHPPSGRHAEMCIIPKRYKWPGGV